MTSPTKLLAGTLLAGMGIATGQTTLTATAAGVGINWLAEGLATLWVGLVREQNPLINAYARALGESVAFLENEYCRTVDPHSDRVAFRLVAACAGEIASAVIPPDLTGMEEIRRRNRSALAALLHDHDPRQVDFLSAHMLDTCVAVFQRELLQDEVAWRAFHGLLLQLLAANNATLLDKLDGFTKVLSDYSDPGAVLDTLRDQVWPMSETANRTYEIVERTENLVIDLSKNLQKTVPHHALGQFRRKNILVVAAYHNKSQVNEDIQVINNAISKSRNYRGFNVIDGNCGIDSILVQLALYKPDILHIVGRGSYRGLLRATPFGKPRPILPDEFGRLFELASWVPNFLVMSGCWSEQFADEAVRHVDNVVGTKYGIGIRSGRVFDLGLYEGLCSGMEMNEAFDNAIAVALLGIGIDLLTMDDNVAQTRYRHTGDLGSI